MSGIPSNIISSVAGAPMQSRELAKDREASTAGQAYAADRQTKAITEAGDVVETTDADAQVFTDSEGTGSQGRSSDEEPGAPHEDDQTSPARGIVRDADGRVHVDLEA